jgi:hypothetical protein
MLQTLPKTRAVEVLANGLVLTLVPADKADDDCYSAKEMCPQPLICADFFSFLRPPLKPKRERCRVKKRPPVPRCVLPEMSRPREHRAAPRREGGADRPGDGGGGGGSDPPPPPRASALFSGRGAQ